MKPRYALLLPLMLSLSVTVSAQEAGAPPPRGPCAQDAQRLCADRIGNGREAMRDCMREHQSDLSDACRARLAQARQNRTMDGGRPAPQAPAPETP